MTDLHILHVSGWALAAALAVGILLGWWLYRPVSGYAPGLSRALAVIRGSMAAILVLLLFDPILERVERIFQKPVVLILQDNSASLREFQQKNSEPGLYQGLAQVAKALEEDYQVATYHLNSDSASGPLEGLVPTYTGKQSNYAQALKEIRLAHWGDQIGLVVLAGDGQITHGGDPRFSGYLPMAPMAVLAPGDTVTKKQWSLTDIRVPEQIQPNKEFPLEFYLQVQGLKRISCSIEVENSSGRSLLRSPISAGVPVPRQRIMLRIADTGLQTLTIRIMPQVSEATSQLKVIERRLGIEVRPLKNKVLILGRAAHPDAGFMKRVLDQRAGIETRTLWLRNGGLNATVLEQVRAFRPDLLVLHDLDPSTVYGAFPELRQQQVACLFILGPELIKPSVRSIRGPDGKDLLLWSGNLSRVHEVRAVLQARNSYLSTDSSWVPLFAGLPPLATSFQVPVPQGSWTPIFWQQIQGISTQRPLVLVSHAGSVPVAMILGSGIWQWPLAEAMDERNAPGAGPSSQFMGRMVQALLEGSQRQLLFVRPTQAAFLEDQRIELETRVYARSGELLEDQNLQLWVYQGRDTVWQGSLPAVSGSGIRSIPGLGQGNYRYLARVDLGDTLLQAKGQIVVEPFDPESWFTGVNLPVLEGLVQHTGGKLFFASQTDTLLDWAQSQLRSENKLLQMKHRDPLKKNLWLLGLLACLAALEWGLRRYWGII